MKVLLALLAFAILAALATFGYFKHTDDQKTPGNQEISDFEPEVKEKKISLPDDLKDVKGIGPAREKRLLDEFGTKRDVLEASDDELAEVIPARIVERLR